MRVLFVCLVLFTSLVVAIDVEAFHRKASPRTRELFLKHEGIHSFFVRLEGLPRPTPPPQGTSPSEREQHGVDFIYNLMAHAKRTQAPVLQRLAELGAIRVTPFWVSNMVSIEAHSHVAHAIAMHLAVIHLGADEEHSVLGSVSDFKEQLRAHPPLHSEHATKRDEEAEWNLQWVGVNEIWDEYNVTGTGIVVGILDTGVAYQHPALVNSYRGYDKTTGEWSHDYNWLDVHLDTDTPYDIIGHGTHVTGTVVGREPGHLIGAAPDAKWISCKGISDNNSGTVEGYLRCFQFFMAPTTLLGEDPRPDLRPHIINNSFACSSCEYDDLLEAVENLVAAGVSFVAAGTNDGIDGCGTVVGTPGSYAAALSVGAQNVFSTLIAGLSSLGPVSLQDGTFMIKPDIVAPGVNIPSSVPPDRYFSASGTSQSSPLVAGVMALLCQSNPLLVRDVAATRAALLENAQVVQTTQCELGPESIVVVVDDVYKNNVYGAGGLNAFNAFEAVQPDPSASASPTITATISATASLSSTTSISLSRSSSRTKSRTRTASLSYSRTTTPSPTPESSTTATAAPLPSDTASASGSPSQRPSSSPSRVPIQPTPVLPAPAASRVPPPVPVAVTRSSTAISIQPVPVRQDDSVAASLPDQREPANGQDESVSAASSISKLMGVLVLILVIL